MRTKIIVGCAIVSAVLASVAGPAAAQGDWLLVSDSAENDARFLVDVSGLDCRVNQHGVHVLGMPLRAVGAGALRDGIVVIDAKGCLGGSGQMIMAIGNASQRYCWSAHGRRRYDAVAASVCAIAATRYRARGPGKDRITAAAPADAAAGRL